MARAQRAPTIVRGVASGRGSVGTECLMALRREPNGGRAGWGRLRYAVSAHLRCRLLARRRSAKSAYRAEGDERLENRRGLGDGGGGGCGCWVAGRLGSGRGTCPNGREGAERGGGGVGRSVAGGDDGVDVRADLRLEFLVGGQVAGESGLLFGEEVDLELDVVLNGGQDIFDVGEAFFGEVVARFVVVKQVGDEVEAVAGEVDGRAYAVDRALDAVDESVVAAGEELGVGDDVFVFVGRVEVFDVGDAVVVGGLDVGEAGFEAGLLGFEVAEAEEASAEESAAEMAAPEETTAEQVAQEAAAEEAAVADVEVAEIEVEVALVPVEVEVDVETEGRGGGAAPPTRAIRMPIAKTRFMCS